MSIEIRVRRLRPGVPLPHYARPGDAGADLPAAEGVRLGPGERALVPTGLAVAIPPGYVGLVHPRSGLAARAGLTIVNAPGTIDAGYRGEIMINLLNTDRAAAVEIQPGDLIAQLVVQAVEAAVFVEAEALDDTERGAAGHGSTGGARLLGFGPAPAARQDGPDTNQGSES